MHKSTLKGTHDQSMAARQTQYATLSKVEQKKQDEWAQDQLKENAGNCPAGFTWYRVENGYRCFGGGHKVTDELLGEGRGGYLIRGCEIVLDEHGRPERNEHGHFTPKVEWCGPFYGVPSKEELYDAGVFGRSRMRGEWRAGMRGAGPSTLGNPQYGAMLTNPFNGVSRGESPDGGSRGGGFPGGGFGGGFQGGGYLGGRPPRR